jgi:hypothetical protein
MIELNSKLRSSGTNKPKVDPNYTISIHIVCVCVCVCVCMCVSVNKFFPLSIDRTCDLHFYQKNMSKVKDVTSVITLHYKELCLI